MLKGLKKGKKENQDSKMDREERLEQSLNKNQNQLKSRFIMEDEDQEENHQTKQLQKLGNFNKIMPPLPNSQTVTLQILRKKAQSLMDLFSKGSSQSLKQEYQKYENAEKKYYVSQKKKASTEISQFLAETKQQQIPKKKFDYEFNYQQSDEQVNQKTRKKHKNRARPVMKSQRIQDYCLYCPDNQQLRLLSASNYVYLALPKRKTFKKYWHLILAPVQHQYSSIALNDDTTTEIKNYKKCLLQMFDKMQMHAVFFQQYSANNSHIYIECLAVPLSKGQDFPFFFKQALQGVQGNWTTHKNILKIQKQKGGLQKQIPMKMKYFYIDFSLGYGYAHVIQNEQFWKRQFCHQVLATALGIQLYQVKSAEQYTDQQSDAKEKQFKKMWEHFDWTKYIQG